MLRYKVKTLATLFLISIQFVGTAFAQSIYPNKSMRIVVGYPPGGTADQLARVLSEGVGKILGQNVIVENRPGANGNLAADFVAKSPADGYTLLMTAPGPVSVNMHVYPSLPFDPKTAFAPIARVAIAPLVLVVNKQLPVQNLKELLAYAKANPSKASYASQGNASSGHLAMELLKSRTALQAEHVPYKGSSPALNDLLAGHVLMMFDNTTSSLPQVRSGNLKAIAIAEDKRIAAAPDIPPVAESGYEGFSATPWFGLLTTAGTPNLVIQKWVASIHEVLKNPAIKDRFAQSGVDLVFDTPEAFSYYIESEYRKWKEVVRISGARAD